MNPSYTCLCVPFVLCAIKTLPRVTLALQYVQQQYWLMALGDLSLVTHLCPCSMPPALLMHLIPLCTCSYLTEWIRELIQLKNCPAHLFSSSWTEMEHNQLCHSRGWDSTHCDMGTGMSRERCCCNDKLYPLAIWLQVYQYIPYSASRNWNPMAHSNCYNSPGTACVQRSSLPSNAHTWLKS